MRWGSIGLGAGWKSGSQPGETSPHTPQTHALAFVAQKGNSGRDPKANRAAKPAPNLNLPRDSESMERAATRTWFHFSHGGACRGSGAKRFAQSFRF